MIDHVTFKVKDLKVSREFYTKALEALEHSWAFGEDGVFEAFELDDGCLFEIAQYRGQDKITSSHLAFRTHSKKQVDAFFEAAIKAGGSSNGKPGSRPNYTETYYACFVLDPDGHNIEAMFDGGEDEE